MIKRVCGATDCKKEFITNLPHAKYCSDTCRSRMHKRKIYADRKEHNLCPQCGKPMDNTKRSYCNDCKKYFKDRYSNIKSLPK